MARSTQSKRRGLSLMEVLIALVLLGIISLIFLRTSTTSIRNTGKAMDWQLETVVIEKTVENLRRCQSAAHLRSIDSQAYDRTGDVSVSVHVLGAPPPSGTCPGFPCDSLAQITVTAKRDAYPDSLSITTFLFTKKP
ncbi:MAG: prepilin-type N-terminal cleavage/methylation domain-containing protein [Fibrobacterota bacterium]|nr:prepilin-type N-terminal cleavage/methylation domain-containing protein [Fibrobacterota bacterium]QQS05683.1 MAG: prepilin-type N-terminal cleavage/methylation domain-containing protein [Fibrobacterota bacterium]